MELGVALKFHFLVKCDVDSDNLADDSVGWDEIYDDEIHKCFLDW